MSNQNKLGFTISYDFISPSQTHDLLEVLDNSAFTHIFVPEVWGYDAFLECARMASHTENLTFGTGIVNMYSRSPATMAQAAASINEQTDGRFILGVGLSGPKVIQNWHGLDYYNGSPMQRTREYLEILDLIFSGETVNYPGTIFQLKNFKLRTFENPIKVPVYLAAFGKKNVQLAGELADGWLPIWTSFPEIPSLRDNFEIGQAQRKKENGKTKEIAPFIVTCASEDPKAKYYVKKQLSFYIGGMGTYYARVVKQYGFNKEVDRIIQAWNSGDRELALKEVTDEMLARLAAVGSPEAVLARYASLRKAGVTNPVVWLPVGCPPALALETIHTFQDN
ncbi:MAG: LLM class flavin-dependent oxidoreductase [Candidatus Hodarchaeales archaeon]|jgi:alkanesulfonate monooxygenase SsuD/methylene tetrahydromethanopterin reductase-like flavin-dependent oxidoreductase (luciferase family)